MGNSKVNRNEVPQKSKRKMTITRALAELKNIQSKISSTEKELLKYTGAIFKMILPFLMVRLVKKNSLVDIKIYLKS